MALRLKRGTNAERAVYTPELGELVYVTDYNSAGVSPLWVGDGTTLGGNAVNTDTDTITSELSDLTDVDTTGVQVGDVLKWNGAAFVPQVEGSFTPGGTYDINIIGDVKGSLVGDDSTILVDGVNSVITGRIRTTLKTEIEDIEIGLRTANPQFSYYSTATNGLFPLSVVNIGNIHNDAFSNEFSLFKARGTIANQTIVQPGDTLGAVTYAGYDGVIPAIAGCVKMEVNSVSAGNISADLVFATRNGDITTYTENVRLKADKGTVTQGYIQFGSYTTTNRNNITPAAGMVIWNETTTQFEGFDGTNWINLVDGTTSP